MNHHDTKGTNMTATRKVTQILAGAAMTRKLVFLSIAGSVVFGGGGVPRSQQAPTPTFRSGVTLVTVDVTVLDADGRPVPDLTAEDFEVKLDGRVQPVRAVAFVRARMGATPAGVAPPAAAPAAVPLGGGEPRVFVLLVDDLSLAPSRGKGLLSGATRFLNSLPESDLVGFATTSGGTEPISPSVGRVAVRTALTKAVGGYQDPRVVRSGEPVIGITDALEIDLGDPNSLRRVVVRECFGGNTRAASQAIEVLMRDNDCAADVRSIARRIASHTRVTRARQADAYTSIIKSLGGVPGIKHVVILSDGIGMVREFHELVPIAKAAAAHGVQLSVLVEEGDISLGDPGRDEGETMKGVDAGMASQRSVDTRTLMSAVQTMTDMSGGSFYRVIGQPDRFFDRVAIASSAVYRLGVEPLANTVAGREFTVSATVKRRGLTVLANRHAIAPDAAAAAAAALTAAPKAMSIEDRLRLAIGAGERHRAIPIRMETTLRRSATAGQIDASVHIVIPATATGPLTLMFGAFDAAGGTRSGSREASRPADGGDYRLSFVIPISAGTHRLRLAAADRTGAIGSVEGVVNAALDALGPFTASDVILMAEDASGRAQPAAIELAPGTRSVQAGIELYGRPGAAEAGDVNVLMSVTSDDPRQPALEQDIVPVREGEILRAAAAFPVTELPAGRYTVRATVLVDGKAVGSKRLAIVKK